MLTKAQECCLDAALLGVGLLRQRLLVKASVRAEDKAQEGLDDDKKAYGVHLAK